MSRLVFTTCSPEETRAQGQRLGSVLEAGDCVALIGGLGAGKTTFTAGVAAGLGVAGPVTSPTYLLCCEHAGRLPLLHLDAYFTARLDALLGEGLAERLAARAVAVVEWADRVAAWLPADRVEVRMEGLGTERKIRCRPLGPRAAARLTALEGASAAGPAPEGHEPASG